MALIGCRVLLPYRQERLDPQGRPVLQGDRPVIEEHAAGAAIQVTSAELLQDRARRYPHLLPLVEEVERKQQEEERRSQDMRRGVQPVIRDRTLEALLLHYESKRSRELSLEEAWERQTGYPLTPED